jgi:hypothetical protein
MYTKDELGYKKKIRQKSKRPVFLTLLCYLFVLYGFAEIINSYVNTYQGMKTFYPAFNSLMVVFGFVAISGIWSMEKWGPISLSIVFPLKVLVEIIFFDWDHGKFTVEHLLEFSLWLIVCVVAYWYMPKMKTTQ